MRRLTASVVAGGIVLAIGVLSSPASAAPIVCPTNAAQLAGVRLQVAPGGPDSLRCANLRGADLDGIDLSGFDLDHANLTDATMRTANLSRADLSSATLTSAVLDGSDLSKVKLTGALANNASFVGANLDQVAGEQVNLNGASFQKASLQNADFAGGDLRGANFTGADVTRAVLTGTEMDAATKTSLASAIGVPILTASIETRILGIALPLSLLILFIGGGFLVVRSKRARAPLRDVIPREADRRRGDPRLHEKPPSRPGARRR
jgi:uncharacterized protein YjbI with pentapeptide repeats